MKTIGVVGGLGPESTIEYYRMMIAAYQARAGTRALRASLSTASMFTERSLCSRLVA